MRLIVIACRDLDAESLSAEAMARQRRLLRFLRAKQHSAQIVQIVQRLDRAHQAFTVSILSFRTNQMMLVTPFLALEACAL